MLVVGQFALRPFARRALIEQGRKTFREWRTAGGVGALPERL